MTFDEWFENHAGSLIESMTKEEVERARRLARTAWDASKVEMAREIAKEIEDCPAPPDPTWRQKKARERRANDTEGE